MSEKCLRPCSRRQSKRAGRVTSAAHLAYVASLGCCVPGCGAPATVHHLRMRGTDACAGRRASDYFAVPLCPTHHQNPRFGVHGQRGEAACWRGWGIDPLALALQLWRESESGQAMP